MAQELPPGWTKEWSNDQNQWYYIDIRDPSHPQSQWNPPTSSGPTSNPYPPPHFPAPSAAPPTAVTKESQSQILGETIDRALKNGVDKSTILSAIEGAGLKDFGALRQVLEKMGLADILDKLEKRPEQRAGGGPYPVGSPPGQTQNKKGGDHDHKWAYGLTGAALGAMGDSVWEKHKRDEAYQDGVNRGHNKMRKARALQSELARLQAENASLRQQTAAATQFATPPPVLGGYTPSPSPLLPPQANYSPLFAPPGPERWHHSRSTTPLPSVAPQHDYLSPEARDPYALYEPSEWVLPKKEYAGDGRLGPYGSG